MAFVNASAGGAAAGNVNHTITLPAGAAAGHKAVLLLGWNFNGTLLLVPAGWDLMIKPAGLSGNQEAVLTKTLTAGDVSAGTFVCSFDSSTRLAWAMGLWNQDVSFGTPVTSTAPGGAGPSVTTTKANSEVLTLWVNAISSGVQGNDLSYQIGTTDAAGKTTVASGTQMAVCFGRVSAPSIAAYDAGVVANSATGGGTNQVVAFEVFFDPTLLLLKEDSSGDILLEDGTFLLI